MSLLLLGASSDPNTRTLFANNEQGLAIDVGDRYGASESKRTWRRNQLLNTNSLTTASGWTLTRITTASSVDAPIVGIQAFNVIPSTDAGQTHNLSRGSGAAATEPFIISVYAKANGYSTFQLNSGNATNGKAGFDVSSGTVVSTGGTYYLDSGIESVGNGWYRCWVKFAAVCPLAWYTYLENPAGQFLFAGDGVSGVLLAGPQLEYASSLSEYQPITDFSTEFKQAYPTHSLYQDSNGVTPAVSPGDPVGLTLDTAKGGLDQLGSELVTNGGFDTDTAWTKGADWSIGSGVATMVAGAGTSISQSIAITGGRLYRVRFTITAGSNITVRIRLGGTANLLNSALSIGTYEYFFFAESSNTNIAFLGSTTSNYSVDNISVREIPATTPTRQRAEAGHCWRERPMGEGGICSRTRSGLTMRRGRKCFPR